MLAVKMREIMQEYRRLRAVVPLGNLRPQMRWVAPTLPIR
jgi:hypothetical protein